MSICFYQKKQTNTHKKTSNKQRNKQTKPTCSVLRKSRSTKKLLWCLKSASLLDWALNICSVTVWPVETWLPLNNQDFVHGCKQAMFSHHKAMQRLDECLWPGELLRLHLSLVLLGGQALLLGGFLITKLIERSSLFSLPSLGHSPAT